MRKYSLEQLTKNGCIQPFLVRYIVTGVGVYNEIASKPSSRHNTVTINEKPEIS